MMAPSQPLKLTVRGKNVTVHNLPRVGILPVSHTEDTQLIQRIARQDAAAYNTLLERYLLRIMNFVRRYTPQQADAEDISQETFIRLWQHAGSWQDGENASVRSWLYRISYNLCMDLLRKKVDMASLDETDLACVYQQQPDVQYEQLEAVKLLEAALQQLPLRQYTAISLHLADALSYAEAADAMQISVQAYESLLARARLNLKQTLQSPQDRWEAS